MSIVWRFFWRHVCKPDISGCMNEPLFIITAYAITGLLLAALCVATWLRARRANLQLRDRSE